MVELLTQEQLLQKLSNLKESTVPSVAKGMKKAALNVEAKAKENCTPGKSPYYRAPYSDDNDPKRIPPHMRDVMFSEVQVSGNQVRGTVGNPKSYAAAVHEGTDRMQARPFILDAIKEKDNETRALLSEALWEGNKEAVS